MGRRQFAEEFQTIYRRLYLVAAGIVGDRTEAEDIVQEAAVVAFRKLDKFQAGSNFAAWVTAIVKHCAANYNRKLGNRRTFATDPSSLDQGGDQPATGRSIDTSEGLLAIESEFDDDLFRVLQQLSADARCCLLLRTVDGLSYAEISSFLDIPAGTAMSHVHRSKQLIRRQIDVTRPSEKASDG